MGKIKLKIKQWLIRKKALFQLFWLNRKSGGFLLLTSSLYAKVIRKNGKVEDLGLIATRVVTTAGVNYLVDAFQNLTELENFKYHGSGTGATAEAIENTTLATEVGTRAIGDQGEGISANIYNTIATSTYAAAYAITEHGIFSASTAGTLWDRSVFAAINVENGEAIQFDYRLTVNAGG